MSVLRFVVPLAIVVGLGFWRGWQPALFVGLALLVTLGLNQLGNKVLPNYAPYKQNQFRQGFSWARVVMYITLFGSLVLAVAAAVYFWVLFDWSASVAFILGYASFWVLYPPPPPPDSVRSR